MNIHNDKQTAFIKQTGFLMQLCQITQV